MLLSIRAKIKYGRNVGINRSRIFENYGYYTKGINGKSRQYARTEG